MYDVGRRQLKLYIVIFQVYQFPSSPSRVPGNFFSGVSPSRTAHHIIPIIMPPRARRGWLLYTTDAADDLLSVDPVGTRSLQKKTQALNQYTPLTTLLQAKNQEIV